MLKIINVTVAKIKRLRENNKIEVKKSRNIQNYSTIVQINIETINNTSYKLNKQHNYLYLLVLLRNHKKGNEQT